MVHKFRSILLITILGGIVSCSVQKDCSKFSWKPGKLEIKPKDSVYIEVDRILEVYCGTYVRSKEGVWYRYGWGEKLSVWEKALVFNEWKSLPPCPRK